MSKLRLIFILFFITIFFNSCRTVYYETMEEFGIEKRDILIDNIKDAKNSQEEAKVQFQSALEKFSNVIEFDGGKLEKVYNQLNSELEKSESRSNKVKDRIKDVEQVAEDLFQEWEKELEDYHNDNLKNKSQNKLRKTKILYNDLMSTMKSAEIKIDPVLNTFKDQVLFLKHNLNAKAIVSITSEIETVKNDISGLIKELDKSITETEKFIKNLEEE